VAKIKDKGKSCKSRGGGKGGRKHCKYTVYNAIPTIEFL